MGAGITFAQGRANGIETLQNTSTFESVQTSSGFNMSLCIPPICYGVPVTATVSLSNQAIDHNYISAVGQSGIAAGKGGFDIAVAGNTDLKGAAITSSASITVGNDLGAMALGSLVTNKKPPQSLRQVAVVCGGGRSLRPPQSLAEIRSNASFAVTIGMP